MALFDPDPSEEEERPELSYRSFTDVPAQRQAVFDRVRDAYAKKRMEYGGHTLEFADVGYKDARDFTLRDEKAAVLGRKRLYRPLRGRLRLLDAEGNVIREDEKARTLAQVPYLSRRGTFIHNGTEYAVANQQRLRAGIYTRRQANGDVESQFNIIPGTGRGFRVRMDPTSGVFRIQAGQSNMKLFPVLKDMGFTDKQLKETWGKEIYEANALADDKDERVTLGKLAAKLGGKHDAELSPEEAKTRLSEIFNRMRLDPVTTRRTMGKAYDHVDGQTLLDSTNRILRVNRDEEDGDDRDDLPFQSFHAPEDFFAEHVEKDAQQLIRQAYWRMKNGKNVPDNFFTKQLQSVLLGSGVAAPLQEINPIELLDARHKIIRLGEGGIGSTQAVSREARGVQPSHFGFIDPIRAPESDKIGLDMRLAQGVVRGSDGLLYAQVRNAKTGQNEYLSTENFLNKPVAFPGEIARAKARLEHPERLPAGASERQAWGKVRAMDGGRLRYVPLDQVHYELPEAGNMFTPGSNFVPLASALKGQRLLMGARMQSQALPLEEPEAPLVQSEAPGGTSMSKLFSRDVGAVFSDQEGVIKKVTPDEIVVQYADGTTKSHDLYNMHPLNQKCVSGDTRLFVRREDGSFFTGEISYYRRKDGDVTLSVDKKTGALHWRPVEAVQRIENDKQLLRVLLASGRSLIVTEDHSLVRLEEHGLEKVAPGELRVGKDFLPSPRKVTVPVKALPSFARGFTPLEFGQLVGIYLAEGSRASDTCHVIACFEPEGAAQILRLVRLLWQGGRWGGAAVYVPSNKAFASWIDDFVGHGACDKRLDRGAATYGEDFARGVLGGFFSGDGWAAVDCNGALQVEAGTRSKELRDDLVFFAQLGGLLTTQREAVVEGKPFFYIRIRTESVSATPWILQRKADTSTIGCLSSRSFDVVPLPRSRRNDFYSYAGSIPRIYHMGNRGRVPVCEIAGDPWLKQWSDELVWDRVVGIEEAPHQDYVYDLSAGNGVFWANGVFIHNTSLHNTPVVKPGDVVGPEQLLARSNFTDGQGNVALGRNLRTAFHMMDGMTHEDAIVLSDSAAQKFRSEQMYSTTLERNDEVDHADKDQYAAKYPGVFTSEQLKNIDKNGVVKPGTVVNQGDPLVLAVGRKKTKVKGSLLKGPKSQFTDASETWEHEQPGEVVDVFKTGKGWRVTARTYTPTTVGDKIANSYGGKGVVARVVPDDQMPTDAEGNPIEIALNPMGVITRVNPSQIIESALGKVAAKTGKPYVLPGFSDKHLSEFAMQELEKHGLSDLETLIDPRTGREMPNIFTGVQHFYKLHHLAESKLNARNQAAYTMDDQPAKGGKDGSKRLGLMESFSLLSHGATEVMRDAKLIRGQRNDDFWRLYRLGMNPPEPRISRQYQKFEAMLQGSGINLKKKGTQTQVLPMTDADVQALAGDREITSSATVDFDSGEPVEGGLFDIAKTGGADGTKWSYVKLPEKLPNPIMEEPVKSLLGLTGKQFERVLSGEDDLHGLTGGKAIEQALRGLNIEEEMRTTKEIIRSGKRTARDKAVKRLGYLTSLHNNQIKPQELMMERVPVVPPRFRPVSRMEGVDLVSDVNYLYKEMLEAKENYEQAAHHFGTPGDTRLDLYNTFKAATGMGKPVSQENQQRNVRGLLKQVLGDSPKYGFYQRSVIGQPVDLVGRGVIVPEPDYDIDEVGLPAEAGWEIFKPFIIRDLTRRGKSAVNAIKSYTDRSLDAQEAMKRVIEERPLIINRAPSLHKHNLTAHQVRLVPGNAIRLPVPILAGHGADFDGDALNFHVPVSDKAVREAKDKMMPSRMLYSAKDFQVHMLPTQGYAMGLYHGSTGDSGRQRRTFRTSQDVIEAYRSGEIGPTDPITVLQD